VRHRRAAQQDEHMNQRFHRTSDSLRFERTVISEAGIHFHGKRLGMDSGSLARLARPE
jgi:hypothetical protein